MEFFDWQMLGTAAGAALAVGILTQITKEIPGIKAIPTQLWSYVLAVVVLVLAEVFGNGLTASGMALAAINAALVSLASNGGYDAVKRAIQTEPPDEKMLWPRKSGQPKSVV